MNDSMKEKLLEQLLEMFESMPENEAKEEEKNPDASVKIMEIGGKKLEEGLKDKGMC